MDSENKKEVLSAKKATKDLEATARHVSIGFGKRLLLQVDTRLGKAETDAIYKCMIIAVHGAPGQART